MMMNHARVKALKGDGKTTSRKAIKSGRASGSVTPGGSLLASPIHSAAASRVTSDVSDNEHDFDLDDMASSVYSGGSVDDEADIKQPENLAIDTDELIRNIRDRKRNNAEQREKYLEFFIRAIRIRYTPDTHLWLDPASYDLVRAFIHDADRALTARERLLSLQAYCITLGTIEDMEVFSESEGTLKRIMFEDDDDDCRVYAIYSLCMTVLYGGGSEEAAIELMEYLKEIVRTGGESIEAADNDVLVAAALQGWAFLASHVSDYSEIAEDSLDTFVEQLESADVDVQSNAGNCIALLFESSRNHFEETGEPFELPYDPQRLTNRMTQIAKQSAKSVSRKHRRHLRESLVSVITSLERSVGPFYSTALRNPNKGFAPDSNLNVNEDGESEFGYRYKLRLGTHVATVDTWSLYFRVNLMKLIFKGGLEKHIFVNPVVSECLEDAKFQQEITTWRKK